MGLVMLFNRCMCWPRLRSRFLQREGKSGVTRSEFRKPLHGRARVKTMDWWSGRAGSWCAKSGRDFVERATLSTIGRACGE